MSASLIAKVANEGGELGGNATGFYILMSRFHGTGGLRGSFDKGMVHFYGESDGELMGLVGIDGVTVLTDSTTDMSIAMFGFELGDADG